MNRREIDRSKRLLSAYADRIETCILDSGGQCLTAHLHDGHQRIFHALDAVEEFVFAMDLRRRIASYPSMW